MLQYPAIDPVAVSLGPFKIHWYGLTYLFGFVAGYLLARYRARKPGSGWNEDDVGDLIFYVALGVIVGGRVVGFVVYNFSGFLAEPWKLFFIWEGGMSFHGGLLGVICAFALFAYHKGRNLFDVADFAAPFFPIGLGAGRIGNFINGELWGRVTDVPWGMVYPHVGPEPRHPNQIYQFLGEGVLFFIAIWWFSSKPRPRMAVSGFFLLFYGIYRFIVEFVREPDAHLGFLAFEWLTMGQVLSAPMILIGAALMMLAYRNRVYAGAGSPATPNAVSEAISGGSEASVKQTQDIQGKPGKQPKKGKQRKRGKRKK